MLRGGVEDGDVLDFTVTGGVLSSEVAKVTVLGILCVSYIYYENDDLCTTCSVESGVGEVLPFPTNSAKIFLS